MWLTKLKCVTKIRRSPMIWTTNATHVYGDMARAVMKIKYCIWQKVPVSALVEWIDI